MGRGDKGARFGVHGFLVSLWGKSFWILAQGELHSPEHQG